MRIVCSFLGYALIVLGGGGLLLLSAGLFPEPVHALLFRRPVAVPIYIPPGAMFLDAPVPTLSPEAPGDVGVESADGAQGTPEASEGVPPAAESGVMALEAESVEAPLGETGEAAVASPPSTPTPRPAPPTRTPEPTVRPVTLTPGQTRAPITRLNVPSIRLESDVVPARLVALGGAVTWEVPAFYVGHGIFTAGAGEMGNSVLLGHVSSVGQGNVFRNLDRMRVGDVVQVFSDERGYDYVTTEVKHVARTDLSIYARGDGTVVTLLTCTGQWLPDVNDFAERLIVRASLVAAHQTPTPTATPSPTATDTPEATSTPDATATATATPDATDAPAPTATPTATVTATATASSTATPTPLPPTATPTRTGTPATGTPATVAPPASGAAVTTTPPAPAAASATNRPAGAASTTATSSARP